MSEPLKFNLDSPKEKPTTTLRVVGISAFVAFIIGCLPALGTALVVSNDLKSTVESNCNSRKAGLEVSFIRNTNDKTNLYGDIQLLKVTGAGAKGDMLETIQDSITAKKQLVATPILYSLPDCNEDDSPDKLTEANQKKLDEAKARLEIAKVKAGF